MGDVLLVACGGGANSTVTNAEDLWSTPMVILSRENATVSLGDKDALRKAMENYRVVITFSIMGGEVGTSTVKDAISCARDVGCKVVSVLGIPMEMEQNRREKALNNLSEMVALSDCSLVFDMQKTMEIFMKNYVDRKFDFFFKMIDRVIMLSINSIVECLEGPFFTTFKEKLYAFASYNDVLLDNAVRNAWGMMLYDKNSEKDGCIIMISSHISSAEASDVCDRVVREHGMMPQIIRRSDNEDSKVIVFRALNLF